MDDQWRCLPYDEELSDGMEFGEFWRKVMETTKYDALSFCVKALLTIPVSNANCERIFSEIHRLKNAERNRFSASLLMKYVAAREGIKGNNKSC